MADPTAHHYGDDCLDNVHVYLSTVHVSYLCLSYIDVTRNYIEYRIVKYQHTQ